ncbi:MAG: hypothetical protein ACW963_02315 [Candidatus Sifarchaeia archaeon]|jgi:hypothetical protein
MTIVLDSDDPEGISDALKITQMINAKYGAGKFGYTQTFNKIAFIKILRQYMRESLAHLKNEESAQVKDIDDMGNLRNAKRFADAIYITPIKL